MMPMTIMYYEATPFEIVFGAVIMIAALVIEILLLGIFFKRIVKSRVPRVTKETLVGIKIGAVLFLLLGVPFIIMGGLLMFACGVVWASWGYNPMYAISFVISSVITAFGLLILFVGVGFWKLNYSALKGSIIISAIIVLFDSIFLIASHFVSLELLIVLIISIGLLIYTFNARSIFLSKIKDGTIEDEEKIPTAVHIDEDKDSGKCPVCGKLNEPNTQICPFCGFNLGKKE